jgi:hypothetical protein
MKICYIDEAGCTGYLPSVTSNIQPMFLIVGLILDHSVIDQVTHDFIGLKQSFFPQLCSLNQSYLEAILPEVKGSDIRKNTGVPGRNRRRAAYGFLNGIVAILQRHGGKIVGRLWVKPPAGTFIGRSVYTSSIQAICTYFDHYLDHSNDIGMIIADSRNPGLNVNVAHSVFTQRFQQPNPRWH